MINLSLLTGYVPQAINVVVIKQLLQKSSLDLEVLANYRNFLLFQKILKAVKQLTDHMPRYCLFEASTSEGNKESFHGLWQRTHLYFSY